MATGLAIAGSLLLVVSFVERGVAAWLIACSTAIVVFGLWLGFPLLHRRGDTY